MDVLEHEGLTQWPVPDATSKACYERARGLMPDGVVGQGRSADPYPIYMRSAKGAEIEDVDGNLYVDFHCGFGSVLLGHADPRLRDIAIDTIDHHGVNFSAAHPLEAELAERLISAVPSAERVVFACTGSEVTYHAIRLARAATGRSKLVKFEGNYHGWHDYVSWSVHFDPDDAGPASHPTPIVESAGVDESVLENVLICGYNDGRYLEELFSRYSDEIAGVIVEPIFHNGGVIVPQPGFLEQCRSLCDAYGSILIFDEIITGFRQALGGAQTIFDVTPDLTTMGKAIANGVPISVLAGRQNLIEGLSPTGDTFFSGTFNGQILNLALANGSCRILEEDPPYDHLSNLGKALKQGFEDAISDAGVSARVEQFGSVWSLYFTRRNVESFRDIAMFSSDKNDPIQRAYQRFMLSRGFYIHPHYMIRGYLTAAHTEEQIDAAVAATAEFLKANADSIQGD